MKSRFIALGLSTLVTVAAFAAVTSWRHPPLRLNAIPGSSHLRVFGSRSAQQQHSAGGAKFDGALAELSRNAAKARPGQVLADLHSMAPAVKFKQTVDATPLVAIDAITLGSPQALKAALVGLGLQHPAVYSNDVGGWLPVAQLDAAAALGEVHSIRAAMSRTRSGKVTTQGDFVQHSDTLRSANGLTGAGVTVGVLSDSFDCYAVYAANGVAASGAAGYASNGFTATAADDVTSGDLPANVNVLEEALESVDGSSGCLDYGAPDNLPFGDEGRAMLQIVHDVAPGAGLAFYTAETSEADFAAGIVKLADPVAKGGAGARVIVDDVDYFDEPFFQDGELAQAVDSVEAEGVAYFSAAGNDGNSAGGNIALAYDNNAPRFAILSTSAPNSGEYLLNFDTTGATTATALPVTIAPLAPGDFVAIVVEWDQPYVTGSPHSGGATSQIDLCITGASGSDQIDGYLVNPVSGASGTCSGTNSLGNDPYQILIVANPANATGNTAAETLNLEVGLVGATTPGRIKIVVEDDGAGSTINAYATQSGTLQGHPRAAGAFAVGAAFYFDTPACGTTPATLEYFSSSGGDSSGWDPILFDSSGARLSTPIVRQKPDAVGPDGGNDTFLGLTLAKLGITVDTSIAGCQNNTDYPNFLGTSAAAPHVASIAALMLQANPALTPAQIYDALRSTALAMGGPTPNVNSGSGFVQAGAAFAALPQVVPAAPSLTLASSSITSGSSTTITWSSVNATGCTASGSWSGALANSGTKTLSPTATGTDTYTLTCANSAGSSAKASAALTVSAAPSGGGGGGGGFDILMLLGLAGLGLGRLTGARRVTAAERMAGALRGNLSPHGTWSGGQQ